MFPVPFSCFRLLTEYHSFLLGVMKNETSINIKIVSVSLRSIIHSYSLNKLYSLNLDVNFLFPSPYGVSFILIKFGTMGQDNGIALFPSPYGVSFILMYDFLSNTS